MTPNTHKPNNPFQESAPNFNYERDIFPGKRVDLFKGPNGNQHRGITDIAMTSNGRWLFSGHSDAVICVWDVVGNKMVRALSGFHSHPIAQLVLTDNERTLISVDGKGVAYKWAADRLVLESRD